MTFVDAHVHIYDCFNLVSLWDAAQDNFEAAARHVGDGPLSSAILLLAETSGENWFRRLSDTRDPSHPSICSPWSVQGTKESGSLIIRKDGRPPLTLVAGRQIVTEEKLEVLALATDSHFIEGLSLTETVAHITEKEGLAVIPWGAGKWTGQRGWAVRNLIHRDPRPHFFLGDNGGRPLGWLRPALFGEAERRGIPILPGSDPLPIGSGALRPGSFGFFLHGTIGREHAARDLKEILLQPMTKIHPYGRLESPYRFIRNQTLIRLAR